MDPLDQTNRLFSGSSGLTARSPILLQVDNLTTVFDLNGRVGIAVDGVSFAIGKGETLGLVGESGSGKTVTALSILRLVQPPGRIISGSVVLRGRDLMGLPEHELRRVRGAEIALIFQEPATALNPVFTVGDQIAETLRVHSRLSRGDALARAVEVLASVSVPEPEHRIHDYPPPALRRAAPACAHRDGTGMSPSADYRRRANDRPRRDDPGEILSLLRELTATFDLSLLLITHDLGVIAEAADRVAVMYAGRIVEEAPSRPSFTRPNTLTRGA